MVLCRNIPVPMGCQQILCLRQRGGKKKILKVTNQLLQCFPADLTQKMYFKCQFKLLQRQVLLTGKRRLITEGAIGKKISAEKYQAMPLPWSGKQIMQKEFILCCRSTAGPSVLSDISKVHLQRPNSHLLHLTHASATRSVWGLGQG